MNTRISFLLSFLLMVLSECSSSSGMLMASPIPRVNTETRVSADDKPCEETDASTVCNIHVYRAVMDPKNVADVFGKRIGKRFVAVQVTIANVSKEYDFIVHDVSIDLSKLKPGWIDDEGDLSSVDLSLLRGVAEKGRSQNRRNLVFNILRASGTIFSAAIGLPIGGARGAWAAGAAVFNGPLITAYGALFPDYSVPQLERLDDSAYTVNSVIPQRQSKIVVAFLPQRLFMNESQRKKFWKDPITVFSEVDFKKMKIIVDGVHVANVAEVPPILTKAIFIDDEARKFGNPKPEVRGRLLGRFLSGSTLTIENDDLGEVTIVVEGTPSDRRIDFLIHATASISPGTILTFGVAKSEHFNTISEMIRYIPKTNSDKETQEDEGAGAGRENGRGAGDELDAPADGENKKEPQEKEQPDNQ